MDHQSNRFILRARTAAQHQSVDDTVGAFDSVANYRRYLRGIAAFRAPLERQLALLAPSGVFGTPAPVMLAHLVALDRADLGDAAAVEEEPIGISDDPSALIGAFYVLEGSSLGARILYKRAQELGLSDSHGARHLAVQSAAPGNWKQFVSVLDTAEGLDIEKAIVAANAVFSAAERALAKQGPAEQPALAPQAG